MLISSIKGALYLVCSYAVAAVAWSAESSFRPYLEAHCFECHDGATKKGGLDLESVCASGDLASRFDVWVQVHDRVALGEMPPKSRQERPPEGETAAMLRGLDERLHQADLGTVAKNGRALLRRLTAQEYENALRDLLQLPSLRIKHLLPEDERRHGYNKIGRALDLSNVHLSQFMDAADLALTQATATRSTPPPVRRQRYGGATGSETWHWMSHGSAVPLRDKQYDSVVPLPSSEDDLNKDEKLKRSRYSEFSKVLREYPHAGGFFTGAVHRPMIFSLQYAPLYAGRYRIRTSAWGFWQGRASQTQRIICPYCVDAD
jgi:hypothetical protein